MCLAVPGRIIAVGEGAGEAGLGPGATVDFQGSRVQVCLAMTPDAGVGDWVLVHAGFAISRLDEAEARQTWDYLEAAEMGPPPAEPAGRGPGVQP